MGQLARVLCSYGVLPADRQVQDLLAKRYGGCVSVSGGQGERGRCWCWQQVLSMMRSVTGDGDAASARTDLRVS